MYQHLNINGKNIFYQVHGQGYPVVLLHGFGETSEVWRNQVEYLAGRFRLIVPDIPGSGRSEIVPDMSMEGLAAIVHTVIEKEAVSSCILIGHSMGGYITLAFAERYPQLLRAFGLFHSSAFADSEEKKATRRKGIEFIREHGGFAFLKTMVPGLFSPSSRQHNPALIEGFITGLGNFSGPALVLYYQAMMERPDRTLILKKASCPALFVLGEHDNVIPLEDGLKQCQIPEKSYIYILSRSGHMGMLEDKDQSNQLLEKFLTEA